MGCYGMIGAGSPAGGLWHTLPPARATHLQKSWLQGTGSLTKRLECEGLYGIAQSQMANQPIATCQSDKLAKSAVHPVEVQVIREGVQTSWDDECNCLGVSAREPVWVREVVLRVMGEPAVVARSVTTLAASQSIWRKLRYLHTTPLAALLYGDAHVTRSSFAYATLGFNHPLSRLILRNTHSSSISSPRPSLLLPTFNTPHSFLARRSLFTHRIRYDSLGSAYAPLLVTECLLADAFTHK